jgi:hypothetical protein
MRFKNGTETKDEFNPMTCVTTDISTENPRKVPGMG